MSGFIKTSLLCFKLFWCMPKPIDIFPMGDKAWFDPLDGSIGSLSAHSIMSLTSEKMLEYSQVEITVIKLDRDVTVRERWEILSQSDERLGILTAETSHVNYLKTLSRFDQFSQLAATHLPGEVFDLSIGGHEKLEETIKTKLGTIYKQAKPELRNPDLLPYYVYLLDKDMDI